MTNIYSNDDFKEYKNKGLTIIKSSAETPVNMAYKWTTKTYDIGNIHASHQYVLEEHWTYKPVIGAEWYRREEDGPTYTVKFPLSIFSPSARTEYVEGGIVKEWHKNGLIHRDGDLPALVSQIPVTRTTLKPDQKCRGSFLGFQTEKTARGCDGAFVQTFEYYRKGRKHRRDGPAVQILDYSDTQACFKMRRQEFWIDGCEVTEAYASSVFERPEVKVDHSREILNSGRWIRLGGLTAA